METGSIQGNEGSAGRRNQRVTKSYMETYTLATQKI